MEGKRRKEAKNKDFIVFINVENYVLLNISFVAYFLQLTVLLFFIHKIAVAMIRPVMPPINPAISSGSIVGGGILTVIDFSMLRVAQHHR